MLTTKTDRKLVFLLSQSHNEMNHDLLQDEMEKLELMRWNWKANFYLVSLTLNEVGFKILNLESGKWETNHVRTWKTILGPIQCVANTIIQCIIATLVVKRSNLGSLKVTSNYFYLETLLTTWILTLKS